jgi:hypothetical protein
MSEVPRVVTPLSELDLALSLLDAHLQFFHGPAANLRLEVAWAHCALEHGHGAKLYNFNFGNITAFGWLGDFYVMHVPPPDPPVLKFRAFDTAVDGATDYWRVMSGRYAPALALFDTGNAYAAGMKLKALGYYTANAEAYSGAMKKLAAYFEANLAGEIPPVPLDTDVQAQSLVTQEEVEKHLIDLTDVARADIDANDPGPGRGDPPPDVA